jgi:drug/metabolite transporter (DMT)-like permease
MRGIDAYSKTLAQFIAAALTLLPYVLLTERNTEISLDARSVIMLIVIGVLHTGIAYALYFGAAPHLSLATVAIYSYTDPIIAVVLSAIVLKEKIGALGVIGAILIVLSSLAIESNITLKNVNKGRENNEN